MALERQVTFWVAALAVFVAVLWVLSDVLLPFVAGMALAYLLDPIARRGERLGIGRAVSALTVLTLGWIVPWFTQVLATTLTVTTVGCLVLITANRLRRRPAVRPDTHSQPKQLRTPRY